MLIGVEMRKLSSEIYEKGEFLTNIINIDEFDKHLQESPEDKNQLNQEGNANSDASSEKINNSPMEKSKSTKSIKRPIRSKFSMGKAKIDNFEIKEDSGKKNNAIRESGGKLNAKMLERLEEEPKKSPTPFEYKIPSESYIEHIKDFEEEAIEDDEEERTLRYLEKKYLAPEFLFNSINPQQSAKTSTEDTLRFEHIVNKILSENYIDYKWYFFVHQFVNKIITTVRPNQNRPNEVIDYNDYVTIRCIRWDSHLK